VKKNKIYFVCISDLPKEGPHIVGEDRQYQIGDTLNLNCTSGKSHPASVLSWFINDEQVSQYIFHHDNTPSYSNKHNVSLQYIVQFSKLL
jgi:hypothetical protein